MTLAYQSDFIELCIRLGVLRFGSFTLKSGRESPYFFNAGLFSTGAAIGAVGRAYAAAALAEHAGRDLPFAFNRKETKDHGEGGDIVGGPLRGQVLIVDDVITAGTAIRESIDIIQAAGARPAGVLLALDRQERGPQSRSSAVQEIRDRYGIPVVAVVNLTDLMHHLSQLGRKDDLSRMQIYRERYGLAD